MCIRDSHKANEKSPPARSYLRFAFFGERSLLELEGSAGRSHNSAVANAVAGAEGTSRDRFPPHDNCDVFVFAGPLCVIFSNSSMVVTDHLMLVPHRPCL